MLLISFVENAFKHGISYIGDSGIDIFMKVTGKELNFSVENNIISKGAENIPSEPGVGLKNVLRRLELLYPGKHEIAIHDNNQRYKVLLNIKF
jgi:two-component system, LytTR family, sensor kinase